MSASYRQVNYGSRAAKSIERKLIAQTLMRLERFRPLDDYCYIGLGSIFYADFLLFHRVLGIRSMVSIEEDVAAAERFEFNLPLKCIDLRMDHSASVLPTLDWSVPCIVWLDYDGELDSGVLADIETVCGRAASGSVLLVTVNAQPVVLTEPGSRVARLHDLIGKELAPLDVVADADLAGWRLARVSRRIIDAAIQRALADRNGALADGKLSYQQLFNFEYADGPKMLTVGGILLTDDESVAAEACRFGDLEQVATAESGVQIQVPVLTTREVLHLDSQLPSASPPTSPGLPPREASHYARIHRHYPLFVDVGSVRMAGRDRAHGSVFAVCGPAVAGRPDGVGRARQPADLAG